MGLKVSSKDSLHIGDKDFQAIRKLVYAFYSPGFSFGKFARANPGYHDHLVRLLIGDVFNDEVGDIFEPMKEWITPSESAAMPEMERET